MLIDKYSQPITQTIIIFEGPDQCGKTEIGNKLSKILNIPYFKNDSERQGFKDDKDYFINMLRYSDPFFLSYLRQSKADVILDRSFPSEYVYSKAFGRETDIEALKWVDEQYSRLNALIIVCYRTKYTMDDDLCPERLNAKKLEEIDSLYREFSNTFTKCKVMFLNVDDENITREIGDIIKFMKEKC